MDEERILLIQEQIRSPRSAAIAGIVFAVLLSLSMLLMYPITSADPTDVNKQWLDARVGTAETAIALIPFAGISLIWFTGVVRDKLGSSEDRFFSTIFLGSGLIIVAMLFVWGATLGAVFGSYDIAGITPRDTDTAIFGFALMNQILGIFGLKMSGAYVFSIGTLWWRTQTMPRYLTILTYVIAVILLLIAGSIREARFLFPGWVFIVSAYVLISNYLGRHEES